MPRPFERLRDFVGTAVALGTGPRAAAAILWHQTKNLRVRLRLAELPITGTKSTRITVWVLALTAIALYAPMMGWGVPHATAPDRTHAFSVDEILPLEPLAEMHNTFVVSKPDRNYGYPWWHYFVVAVAYAPYVGYLMVSGGLSSPIPEFPFGLQDPVTSLRWLTLIGRSVTLLMAAGTVIASYYFSRILWGQFAGVIAAVLTMLSYLMWYYSRTGNLDVPAFFWSSVGFAIFATILVKGLTVQRAVLFGIFAGLAMATKDQALVFFLPFGLALLLPRFNHSRGSAYQVKPLLFGLGASLLAYLIGTGMAVDPQRHLTHIYSMFFEQRRISNVGLYRPPQPHTWHGTMELTHDYLKTLLAGISSPVLLASAAGALLVLRSAPSRLVVLLPVPTLFLMLALPTGYAILRYVLPLTLFIDSFAAFFIVRLRRSFLRPAWIPVLVILCGWRLLIGVDLTYAQYHETRSAASEWFNAHARPGDRVGYFGIAQQLPHLPAEINTRRVADRPDWKGRFDHGPAVLRYLATEGPEYLAIIPDAYSKPGMDRSGDCPPEVYDALIRGATRYRQVAFFPTPSLLAGPFRRPNLDYPSVSPPVRIFAREDVLARPEHTPGRS